MVDKRKNDSVDQVVEEVEFVDGNDQVVVDETASNTPVNVSEEPKKTFDEVVSEVLVGKWGRGQARRLALAQAGFNHLEVEAELIRRKNNR